MEDNWKCLDNESEMYMVKSVYTTLKNNHSVE